VSSSTLSWPVQQRNLEKRYLAGRNRRRCSNRTGSLLEISRTRRNREGVCRSTQLAHHHLIQRSAGIVRSWPTSSAASSELRFHSVGPGCETLPSSTSGDRRKHDRIKRRGRRLDKVSGGVPSARPCAAHSRVAVRRPVVALVGTTPTLARRALHRLTGGECSRRTPAVLRNSASTRTPVAKGPPPRAASRARRRCLGHRGVRFRHLPTSLVARSAATLER